MQHCAQQMCLRQAAAQRASSLTPALAARVRTAAAQRGASSARTGGTSFAKSIVASGPMHSTAEHAAGTAMKLLSSAHHCQSFRRSIQSTRQLRRCTVAQHTAQHAIKRSTTARVHYSTNTTAASNTIAPRQQRLVSTQPQNVNTGTAKIPPVHTNTHTTNYKNNKSSSNFRLFSPATRFLSLTSRTGISNNDHRFYSTSAGANDAGSTSGKKKCSTGCDSSTGTPYGADIVGIDLGTTNSCVAVMEGSTPKVIENADGHRTMPSVVAFTDEGSRLVGMTARQQAVTNPENTFYATKRLIGRRFDEASVQSELQHLPYKVVRAGNGDAALQALGATYTPSQIGAFVLGKLAEAAGTYMQRPIGNAVITVPAYFNDSQRQATKDAGRIAGLDVKRIINEPTAAALAYGLNKADGKTIAVFDLGGGTFDISILEIIGGVYEVKATNGCTTLGGEDLDQAVLQYLVETFKRTDKVNLAQDPISLQRLREAAEGAKRHLSSVESTNITLPFITPNKNLKITLSRRKLEELTAAQLNKVVSPCEKCLVDSGIKKSEISEVILVGGMTRMPKVGQIVKGIFNKDPLRSVNPDEAVALGAAIQAGVLQGEVKDLLLLDVTPLSLGIETLGGVFTRLIPRNTTIPVRKAQTFSTATDNQTQVGIRIHQGEREMAVHNKFLGQFDLTGIPPAQRGVPQIDVSFDIDANGILNVSANDKSTGKQQQITVQSSGGLSDTEIDRMMADSERFKELDQQAKEVAEARNEADVLLHAVNAQIHNLKDKVPASDVEVVSNHVASLRTLLDDSAITDAQLLRDAMKLVQDASWSMSSHMYSKTSGTGTAAEDDQ